MSLQDYLSEIRKKALEEKDVLDVLSQKDFGPIEIRAAKSSLQVLIEALIGKSKRILKHYNCPIIPQRSKDAIYILYEVGMILDEEYSEFSAAIGFGNIMIHDCLDFDEKIVEEMVKKRRYEKLIGFLIQNVDLNDVLRRRIENFTL